MNLCVTFNNIIYGTVEYYQIIYDHTKYLYNLYRASPHDVIFFFVASYTTIYVSERVVVGATTTDHPPPHHATDHPPPHTTQQPAQSI